MKTRQRWGGILTALGLACAGVAIGSPAANASSFMGLTMASGSSVSSGGTGCTAASSSTTPGGTTTVSENGSAPTLSTSGTMTTTGAGSDSITASTSMVGTARVTSNSSGPKAVDLNYVGTAKAHSVLPASACSSTSSSSVTMTGNVTLTRPMILRMTVTTDAATIGQVIMSGTHNTPAAAAFSINQAAKGTDQQVKVLPADTYSLVGQGSALIIATKSADRPASVHIHLDFLPIGAATGTQSGSGRSYVTLPGTRSCGTHKVVARLKGKLAKARSAVFKVNGHKVRTVAKPHSGQSVALGLPDTKAVTVTATTTFKNGRKASTARSYYFCS